MEQKMKVHSLCHSELCKAKLQNKKPKSRHVRFFIEVKLGGLYTQQLGPEISDLMAAPAAARKGLQDSSLPVLHL